MSVLCIIIRCLILTKELVFMLKLGYTILKVGYYLFLELSHVIVCANLAVLLRELLYLKFKVPYLLNRHSFFLL